jgi:hypothetical protein
MRYSVAYLDKPFPCWISASLYEKWCVNFWVPGWRLDVTNFKTLPAIYLICSSVLLPMVFLLLGKRGGRWEETGK